MEAQPYKDQTHNANVYIQCEQPPKYSDEPPAYSERADVEPLTLTQPRPPLQTEEHLTYVDSRLGLALLATLCFMPLGVVAVVMSCQVTL